MRYVLEAITHNVRQSQSVTVVERVFVNAGSHQYSTVECDIMPARIRSLGTSLDRTLGTSQKTGAGTGLYKQ
jgi:hypothetical protein